MPALTVAISRFTVSASRAAQWPHWQYGVTMRVNIEMTKAHDIHRVFTSKYHCIYKHKVLICQSVHYCLSS